MVGVETPAVPAVTVPATRRPFERPAAIAAVVGIVAVVALVLVRPDPSSTTALDAGSIDVSAPAPLAADGPALPPTAVTAPGTGAYAVRTAVTVDGTNTGGSTSSERSTSLRVESVEGAPDDGSTYRTIATQRGGVDEILAYRPDGVFVVAVGSLGGCMLDSPVKLWSSPMTVGDAWSAQGTCSSEGGTVRSASVTQEARVVGTKSVTILAETVQGFVVESTRVTEQQVAFRSNEGVSRRVEKRVEVFVPTLGLPVEVSSNATTVSSGAIARGSGEQTTSVTTNMILLGTTPAQPRTRGPGGGQGGEGDNQ